MAGLGIHVLCFVDDYLVVGDTEELTRRGGEVFEQVMSEFGLHWAPHKQRGPSRCIEFLGLLVCNVEGLRCIGLSRKRQARLREMISAWASRRPRQGRVLEVGPRELAVLLGHLVFGSQVVPGGRTYMQGMLAQFRGLEVDWNHGQVRFSDHRDGRWLAQRAGVRTRRKRRAGATPEATDDPRFGAVETWRQDRHSLSKRTVQAA